jgi:hypothetical protein
MARYNSSLASTTVSGTATIGSPYGGAFTEFTGTAPYTVTLPSPIPFPGTNQTFYNATGGTVTLSTPAGIFTGTGGSGANTVLCYAGNVLSVTSDGANYIVISEDGSALVATTGTFNGDVTMNGSGATVSVTASTLTLNPATTGSMDRVNIGANNRGSGAFTSLAANSAVAFTANTASTTTGTGSLVVTGGVGVSGQVTATTVSATNIYGTIQTASQPNITSLGNLTALTVNGALTNGAGIQRYSVSVSQQGNLNKTYELMRVSRDTVNWSSQITYEVTVNNNYYTGGRTRWFINYAGGTSTISCVEASGPSQLRCYFGTEVTVSGTIKYMPILIDMPNYQQMSIEVVHQSTVVGSTPNSSGQVQFIGTLSSGSGSNYGGDIHLAAFSGNVGVGTTSAGAKLDVYQGSAATGLQVYVNDVGTANIMTLKGYDNSLGVQTRMVVQANGNVGINTTDFSAGYTFNVAKRARFNGMMLGNSDGSSAADNRIQLDWSSGSFAQIIAQQNVPLYLGVAGSAKVALDSGGHWLPLTNDTQNLGSATQSWANIYTNDLHLNNETKVNGNDVDGTTGNWTIQEGAENLYIINNKTGKQFAFVLKELE